MARVVGFPSVDADVRRGMPSHELEAHDEARFARIETCFWSRGVNQNARVRHGEPERMEAAWGVVLPESFCEFIRRLDGGELVGQGGVMLIWWTTENLALHREDYRAFKSTPGARVVFFGSDNGHCEYFFDVDDYYGHGAYAVLVADQASDLTFVVGATFYEAAERVMSGPPTQEDPLEEMSRARPAGSERV